MNQTVAAETGEDGEPGGDKEAGERRGISVQSRKEEGGRLRIGCVSAATGGSPRKSFADICGNQK